MAATFENVSVFPVRERDGGRDVVSGTGVNRTILQVKWSASRSRKAASWLENQIKAESENIARLVAEGCTRYILMTNVEGSATPKTGARDQIDGVLERMSQVYGVEMTCWWAADLDARVDAAPWEIKAAYVDMLAGTDALIALLRSETLQSSEEHQREILKSFVGKHWERDKRVKFRQVDLASDLIARLFVDIGAIPQQPPLNNQFRNVALVPGVARHLMDSKRPRNLTLLEGIPGQGKSTVAQYVCQVYRAAFIGREKLESSGEAVPPDEVKEFRVPIRLDLTDYADWIEGSDPFSGDPASTPRGQRNSVEDFIRAHFEVAAVGVNVTIADVRNILERFPTFIVFDGLDEVASPELRATVVENIDDFVARWILGQDADIRLVVTTRPNASGLAEPGRRKEVGEAKGDRYERLVLMPLDESTKKRYLRRWAAAQELSDLELRNLERVFDERSVAPHVAQLSQNPMQLTILLHLMRTRDESLPLGRSGLYRAYMDLFLEREAAKWKIVREYRDELEESTAYIGWMMQSLAEVDASASRVPEKKIIKTMRAYLASMEKGAVPVEEIFRAQRERVWVLTSKVSDMYEFDVQSIREFFCARFLAEFAEPDNPADYSPELALSEMLPRAYWANTARFLAGLFPPRLLPNLVDVIEEQFEELHGVSQVWDTAWSILCDGVFKARPRSQRRVALLFSDDWLVRYLADQLRLSSVPSLPPDLGGRDLATYLCSLISQDVFSGMTVDRAFIAGKVGDVGEIRTWWATGVASAAGTDSEAAWLAVGIPLGLRSGLPGEVTAALELRTPDATRAALAVGVTPTPDSVQAARLVDAVLDGHCSDVAPAGASEAADLLRVVAPHLLLDMVGSRQAESALPQMGHQVPTIPQSARTAALRRLADRHGRKLIQESLRIRKGESGTTSRWVDAARALSELYGRPTWIATECSAIAASTPEYKLRSGGRRTKGSLAHGPSMDYGQWLPEVRANRGKREWWVNQLESCTDPHSKATWALGLIVVADRDVFEDVLGILSKVLGELPEASIQALVATSSRIGCFGVSRRLSEDLIRPELSGLLQLLVAHQTSGSIKMRENLRRNAPAINVDLPSGIAPLAIAISEGWRTIQNFSTRVDGIRWNPEVFGNPPKSVDDADVAIILDAPEAFPPGWVDKVGTFRAKIDDRYPLRAVAASSWGITLS